MTRVPLIKVCIAVNLAACQPSREIVRSERDSLVVRARDHAYYHRLYRLTDTASPRPPVRALRVSAAA
jgi:hypothetical protein